MNMESMYRQIFTSDKDINITVPNEWKGMNIEVIAFPVTSMDMVYKKTSNAKKRKKRDELLDKYLIDLSNFKFNREEANDYD
jgi:hypothetical protein